MRKRGDSGVWEGEGGGGGGGGGEGEGGGGGGRGGGGGKGGGEGLSTVKNYHIYINPMFVSLLSKHVWITTCSFVI